jgi:hypothetical protein
MDHMVVDMVVLVLVMVVVDNHIFLLLDLYTYLNLLYLNQLYLKRIHHRTIQILDMDHTFYLQLIQCRHMVVYL